MNYGNKIKQNNGDCTFTVIDKQYKFLVRIDDETTQQFFAQKIKSVLNDAETNPDICLTQTNLDNFQTENFKNFSIVCKKLYGMSEEKIKNLMKVLDRGFEELEKITNVKYYEDDIVACILAFSVFLEFRKLYMELNNFPKIFFVSSNSNFEFKAIRDIKQIGEA